MGRTGVGTLGVLVGAAAPGATGGKVDGAPNRGDKVLVAVVAGGGGDVGAGSTTGAVVGSAVDAGANAGGGGTAVLTARIGVGMTFSAGPDVGDASA